MIYVTLDFLVSEIVAICRMDSDDSNVKKIIKNEISDYIKYINQMNEKSNKEPLA